ncbi:unnamed protein product [Pseudo-nitzschia multistriata]|uniref:Globin family profile domain-containing protein n=1 Tax=Pseudo-nitzschia multistriata TaxID=183589 RepID=A0A448Z2T0_9STRA|nr:unnamed protein product [Pseudo-nitzschia multistriata]
MRKGVFEELKVCISNDRLGNKFDTIGVEMFKKLFETFPEIKDHFCENDVEDMSYGLFEMIYVLVQGSGRDLANPQSNLRKILREQSMKWVELGLSTHVVYLIGREILEGMETIFGDSVNHSKEKLRNAFAFLWKHSIQFVLHPILLQQNLQAEALKFYNDVAAELKWKNSKSALGSRGETVQNASEGLHGTP